MNIHQAYSFTQGLYPLTGVLQGVGVNDCDLKIPFTHEEYHARLQHVRAQMAQANLDVLFVTSPEGMCYLHGYQANWYQAQSLKDWPALTGTVVNVDHDHLIHFDFPYEQILLQATSVVTDIRFYPEESLQALNFLIKELHAVGWLSGRIGLEFWSYRPNRAISTMVEAAFIQAGCAVTDGSEILRQVRRIKSPQEIAYVEEAARILMIGHQAVQDCLRPGITELDVAGEMQRAMMHAGGEPAALLLSLQAGPLATIHGLASRRIIQAGEHIIMDPCGVVNRYHANIARGYFLGEPPRELVALYAAAGGAFQIFCETARAGEPVDKVKHVLRQYYQEAGIWDYRQWVGGYELGLSFPPDWVGDFSFTVEQDEPGKIFQAGMVTNFESVFHTALIDTVVYETQGTRNLSAITPELIVIA